MFNREDLLLSGISRFLYIENLTVKTDDGQGENCNLIAKGMCFMITGRLVEVNDKYYAILNLKHPDGRRLQKRFNLNLPVPNNKRRAQEKLNELCIEYTRKQQVEQNHPDVLLMDYVKEWIERRRPEISPTTYRNYLHMADHHMDHYFGETALRQITFREIEAYYQYLRNQKLSSTTIQHHHMLLQSVFREACRQEIILRNPVESVMKPKRQRAQISYYSEQEARQLVVTLTLAYGLRRSEVLGLRWQDVDFDKQTILVRHSVVEGVDNGRRVVCRKNMLKQAASRRTLPLFEPITTLLHEEWERKKALNPIYVYSDRHGNVMKPDVVTHDFQKFLKENGLRHIRFHDLRHSCASLLIAAHTPLIQVQHWLGHRTMLTTADLYSHLDSSLINECSEGMKKI